ncbi:ribonuclease catalytic domain-containing protein [Desulfovibrio sp. OttesenSCG-928-C06]|nr:ribonuclease catalytic domain-containing protein [Desulfovibrio sp. OttesenSCG-928-C06]
MSNSVKFAAAGCIVEMMQSGHPLLAWVMEEQSGQLRLMTINKREMKMQASRLLPWLGPVYSGAASRQDIQERLELHRKKRAELAESVDMEEVWELAQGEIRQAEARWFAELVWPDPDADQIAAMGQALLGQKTLFKFSPPYFEVYSAEQVEERRVKQLEEDARMELATLGAEVFRKLYEASRQRKVVPEDELLAGVPQAIADTLRSLLMERLADPDAHDPDGVWKNLLKALPVRNAADDAHLPLLLAVAWGLVPEHHNFWFNRSDYDPDSAWYREFSDDISDLAKVIDKLREESGPVPELDLVSIDPDSTRDWDDAVFAERLEGGGYRAVVALACPVLAWPFGSALDRAVMRRATSLYLPEGEHFMMPEELSLGVFTLKAGEARPALTISMEFDADGQVTSMCPQVQWVNVRANLTQRQCELALGGGLPDAAADEACEVDDAALFAAAMATGADDAEALDEADTVAAPVDFPDGNPAEPYSGMLQTAFELAEKLKALRIENGAVITERPEIEISLRQGSDGVQVSIRECLPAPKAQSLVGELMIAATYQLACWASGQGVPLIYRSQDVALPKDFGGVWTREEEIARVLKALPPSVLGLEPKPHAGIGHKLYSSFTAPMRRYTDLINEAQVVSFLRQGQPQFSPDELAALLPQVNSRLDVVGQSQRYRPRYWKLLHIQQQDQQAQRRKSLKYWNAVITDENNHFVSIMVTRPQLYLRGPRGLFGERTLPGTPVKVRLGKLNPLRNEIQIMEVLEE